jgi:hypothetical protein
MGILRAVTNSKSKRNANRILGRKIVIIVRCCSSAHRIDALVLDSGRKGGVIGVEPQKAGVWNQIPGNPSERLDIAVPSLLRKTKQKIRRLKTANRDNRRSISRQLLHRIHIPRSTCTNVDDFLHRCQSARDQQFEDPEIQKPHTQAEEDLDRQLLFP